MDVKRQEGEVRRDAYGAPLKVYIESDSDEDGSSHGEEQENDALGEKAGVGRLGKKIPSFKFMRWGSRTERGTTDNRQHVTKGLHDWMDKVRERRCPGYGVRRDLKNWCDRVLQRVEGNEEYFDLDLTDADQIDLGDEGTKTTSSATGLGAELKAYWMRTVEDEVEQRSAVMREKWEEDMKFELEELKELREQNKLLTKELSDQRSEMDALTLRLHIIKTKQTKTEAEKKEDQTKKNLKGKAVSSSGMAAREMLSDEKGDVDAQHKLNQTIDELKRKNRGLEHKIEEVCKDMDAANRRVEQLEQQIQYMAQQNEEEVQELHRRIEEEESVHECRVQELEQKLKEAKKVGTPASSSKKPTSPEPAPRPRRTSLRDPAAKSNANAASEWKKEKDDLKKEIARLRARIDELEQEAGYRDQGIEEREGEHAKKGSHKPRAKKSSQKISSLAEDSGALQLDPPVQDPQCDDSDDTPREAPTLPLIDPVPFRLDGAKTIVKIIRNVFQQYLGEESRARPIQQEQRLASTTAPSMGHALMGAISSYIHQVMQNKDVGDDFFVPTKEQGAARMMTALEVLTLVSSIERKCADRLTEIGEIVSSPQTPANSEEKVPQVGENHRSLFTQLMVAGQHFFHAEQDTGKPPRASSREYKKSSRNGNQSPVARDRQQVIAETSFADDSPSPGSDFERDYVEEHSSTSDGEEDIRAVRRERGQEVREGRPQRQEEYGIMRDAENLDSEEAKPALLGRAQRRVGWLGMEESEIGDFPIDPLTGSQASSPGELSDSSRLQFFSIRSYLGKHKRKGHVSPINTSVLSRPLSAPPRVVHMERESDRWHRRNVRRLKRSRVITSTPQKGICLEPSCRRRKAARRKKTAKLEKFRIETEIHPMRGHTSAIKGYRLQKISKSMKEEMDAKIEMKANELREVLKQVQMAYFKASQELAQSQAQQRELVEAVQESRDLWLRAQDDKVLLQQEIQDLRKRLHDVSLAAA